MEPITKNFCVLSPAYGRDYTSSAQCRLDFLAGKDFKMESLGFGGTYCSIRDFAAGVIVELRYARLTKLTTLEVPPQGGPAKSNFHKPGRDHMVQLNEHHQVASTGDSATAEVMERMAVHGNQNHLTQRNMFLAYIERLANLHSLKGRKLSSARPRKVAKTISLDEIVELG